MTAAPPIRLRDLTYLAKGKRGVAYTARLGARTVLVKERNPDASVDTIAHEARILRIINKHGLGPRFIALEPGRIIREFVIGTPIEEWTRTATPRAIRTLLVRFLDQCRTLDRIGINKAELTRPYKHLLVRRGAHPVQIDYDRARETPRPQNVTQACQFLTSGRYGTLLRERGLSIDKDALIAAARNYKKTYSDLAYDPIVRIITRS